MQLTNDIKPISYVKANTGKVLEQVNTSGPIVITQNGEASAVLMGVRDYDNLQESLALLKVLSISNKAMEEGKGIEAKDVFNDLANRIALEKERLSYGK